MPLIIVKFYKLRHFKSTYINISAIIQKSKRYFQEWVEEQLLENITSHIDLDLENVKVHFFFLQTPQHYYKHVTKILLEHSSPCIESCKKYFMKNRYPYLHKC